MKTSLSLFWFRRDLRLEDNFALSQALQSGFPVQCIFIFDPDILDLLDDPKDRRLGFIHQKLEDLQKELRQRGSELWVFHGNVHQTWEYLCQNYSINSVFAAEDYEPLTRARDQRVAQMLQNKGIPFHLRGDHLILPPTAVLKSDGTPYTVFTPFFKAWKTKLAPAIDKIFVIPDSAPFAPRSELKPIPTLPSLGFEPQALDFGLNLDPRLIRNYAHQRDFPATEGTSYAGIHLRFGTVSPRSLARLALNHSEVWLSELAWRDFFAQILFHFPHSEHQAFKSIKDPKWNQIPWINNPDDFEKWKEGMTGYPWIDAGMRQFKATGWMHNRVRMAIASFLCKHLLIDWKWGERYFAQSLLDYDLSANVGNWQWAAGTGCDAQPWFRIFNPELQAQKFDPNGEYVRRWVPEINTARYPKAMIDHSYARQRALVEFGKVLKDSQ